MGAKADLVNEQETILTGMDSIVIRNYLGGIMNGRTLDMTGFKQSVIKAGHIVIRDTENDTYCCLFQTRRQTICRHYVCWRS